MPTATAPSFVEPLLNLASPPALLGRGIINDLAAVRATLTVDDPLARPRGRRRARRGGGNRRGDRVVARLGAGRSAAGSPTASWAPARPSRAGVSTCAISTARRSRSPRCAGGRRRDVHRSGLPQPVPARGGGARQGRPRPRRARAGGRRGERQSRGRTPVANFRADARAWRLPPSWRWATGSQAELARVWRSYGVAVQMQTKHVAGVTVRNVIHTEGSYLIDAQGFERPSSSTRSTPSTSSGSWNAWQQPDAAKRLLRPRPVPATVTEAPARSSRIGLVRGGSRDGHVTVPGTGRVRNGLRKRRRRPRRVPEACRGQAP